jgi:hypothetical protein
LPISATLLFLDYRLHDIVRAMMMSTSSPLNVPRGVIRRWRSDRKVCRHQQPAPPQAINLIDAEGRSTIYVPITQDGKVVHSQGYVLDLEDE